MVEASGTDIIPSHRNMFQKTPESAGQDELVEALEAPVKDDTIGVTRRKVRAKKDGVEGFVSTLSNKGTVYFRDPHRDRSGRLTEPSSPGF